MSTILNTNGETRALPRPLAGKNLRCVIISAEWNPRITGTLTEGAVATLREAGISEEGIIRVTVPGTVELVNAAALYQKSEPDAIIVIGCVIRGDTPHFDYVCQQASTGVAMLNSKGETPVIFGVLTVDNLQQALDRAGGCLGNKGSEAAVAAIEMSNLHQSFGKTTSHKKC